MIRTSATTATTQLDAAANAVFALIDARKFDEAEQAAHDVLARFPVCMTATSVLAGSTKPKATTAMPPNTTGRSSSSPARTRTSTIQTSWTTSRTLIDRLEPQAAAG